MGPRVALVHAQVGEQHGQRVGHHTCPTAGAGGRPAIGVQGQLLAGDAFAQAGLCHQSSARAAASRAASSQPTTTLPVTYAWQATGQAPIVHARVFSITDAVSFTWALAGSQTITLTAANAVGVVSSTVVIAVTGPRLIYLSMVWR